MSQATLVVDLGAHATGAAVVDGEHAVLVRDPQSGAALRSSCLAVDAGKSHAGAAAERLRMTSPGSVLDGPRQLVDAETAIRLADREFTPITAVADFLGSIRAEAIRLAPRGIDRLVLTVPTSYPVPDRRRDLLIAAGEASGFAEVELIGSAAATALDARSRVPLREGSLVLVCDLGQTWSTTLVRIGTHEAVPIAQESAYAGSDLDSRLLSDLRDTHRDWLEPIVGQPGEDGLRAYHQAVAFVRHMKHAAAQLDDGADVTGRPVADAPPYRLSRAWLDRLAEPGLRWVGASSRSVLARAAVGWDGPALADPPIDGGAGPSPLMSGPPLSGATLDDIDAVILSGGHARLTCAGRVLGEELQRPLIRLDDPELAPVRGAACLVATALSRRIVADHPKWRIEPLAWDVPTGRARLERWLVDVGEPYRRGAAVAQVRTLDERVYELAAPDDGVLIHRRGRIGAVVGPTLIAAAKRPASLLAGDPPDKLHEFIGSGEWLFTPDRRVLVECAPTAEQVRLWSVPDGALLREFTPRLQLGEPRRGRVFVHPAGGLALVTWDRAGNFAVWDVRSGQCTARFRDTHAPTRVLVNEREWRLSTEGEDAGTAGRYRRAVATVWDLSTGRRLEKLTDNLPPRLPGYGDRSVSDRFDEKATSPDGQLRALPVLSDAGLIGIAVQDSTSTHEVFRAEHAPSTRVRVAFSADGRFLLANREAPRLSQVDVWEL